MTEMHIGASSYLYSGTGYSIVPPDANAFQLRARNYYDAVGRLITHSQYASPAIGQQHIWDGYTAVAAA